MNTDPAAQALLVSVVDDWRPVLDDLRNLVASVWKADVDRYEPRLGDDALTLGIQASRNICNLAVPMFRDRPGVKARDMKTLEISYQGRSLHIGKVTSTSDSWPVEAMTWERDVRRRAAEANSAAYVSTSGTLFEGDDPADPERADPAGLAELYVAWQGISDGRTKVWIGFPSAEAERTWFAVVRLDDAPSDGPGLSAPDDQPLTPTDPNFDQLDETDIPPMSRRSA